MAGFGIVADVTKARNIGRDIKRYLDVSGRATKIAVSAETGALKNDLRDDVRRVGLGDRLSKTWQSKVYPEGGKSSMDAAGLVYSKAAHIINAYDSGVVIRARKSKYLAVPLPAAQKYFGLEGKRRRITPDLFKQKYGYDLRFVKRRGKNPILVADGMRVGKSGSMSKVRASKATKNYGARSNITRRATVPLFVLIPQVTVRKRLNVKKFADAAVKRLPDRLYEEKMRLLK